ncbi:MAG: hypothetical protein AMXMBFR81_07430 [Chthonomonas sp.]
MSPTPLPIEMRPFVLTRWRAAWLASLQYWRRWWFVMVAYPVFGVLGLSVSQDPYVRGVAIVALLWPLTVPLRSLMRSAAMRRRFGERHTPFVYEDFIALETEGGQSKGFKVPFSGVRDVDCTREAYLLHLGRYIYFVLPAEAFADQEARTAFEKHLRKKVPIVRPIQRS